jgi:GNAT superfamily N-acetyltransferase
MLTNFYRRSVSLNIGREGAGHVFGVVRVAGPPCAPYPGVVRRRKKRELRLGHDTRAERVLNDQEMMRLHVETLFTHDSQGRMLCVNEPHGKTAPRFFLGRTAHGNVWRFGVGLEQDLVEALELACLAEPIRDEVPQSPFGRTRYEELLARSAPIQHTWAGPAYRFPEDVAARSETVLVTAENSGLLHPNLVSWLDDVALCQPVLVSLSGGRAVSVCCSVRKSSGAHEAGVETAPEFRRRGYAAQAVAAWAEAVRALGCIPLYSTSWENTPSQGLAQRLGLTRYGADLHIT